MTKLFLLLFICHFLGDFSPLSTAWMLKAKQFGKPLHPILVHAAIHAGLMLIVLLFFTTPEKAITLATFQLAAHFIIDTWKGIMNVWFPLLLDNTRKAHWMVFGFDQLLHQITIVAMIYLLENGLV